MALSKRNSITITELYQMIPPERIFEFYCTHWKDVSYKLDTLFISDTRGDDKRPSAMIKKSISNKLYYIDFGDGIPQSAVYLVSYLYSITIKDAIDKILLDIPNNNESNVSTGINMTRTSSIHSPRSTNTRINIQPVKWNKSNFNYWKQYGWTVENLEKCKIYQVTKIWVNGKRIFFYDKAFCITYYTHNNIIRRKIYFPERTDNRFISNVDTTIVQGWEILPKQGGDVLIITKAFKDIGSFLNIGIYSCATNNETSFFPENVIIKLKKRWKHIIVWWDNDRTGVEMGLYFALKYDLKFICNDYKLPKDPSDLFKAYGKEKFKEFVNLKLNLNENTGNKT